MKANIRKRIRIEWSLLISVLCYGYDTDNDQSFWDEIAEYFVETLEGE